MVKTQLVPMQDKTIEGEHTFVLLPWLAKPVVTTLGL